MEQYNIVAATTENTVVTSYEPVKKTLRQLPERSGAGA